MSASTTGSRAIGDTLEPYKEIIRALYLVEDLSLGDVVKKLNEKHHIRATKAQIEYRCKIWNFRKNLKKGEWDVVTPKILKRKRDGKESEVCVGGLILGHKKIKKALSRYGFSSVPEPDAPSPRTPEGISICTPQPSSATATLESVPAIANSKPIVGDYVRALIESVPFLQFMSMINVQVPEYYSESYPGESRMTSLIQADNIPAKKPAFHFTNVAKYIASDSFNRIVEAFMPWTATTNAEGLQMTTQQHLVTDLPFLKLMLCMASNKLMNSATRVSREMFEWIKDRNGVEDLMRMLAVGGPTSEALGEHIFSLAIEGHDARTVQRLLKFGLNPNELRCSNEDGPITPLQRACQLNYLDVAAALINGGANVNGTTLTNTYSPPSNVFIGDNDFDCFELLQSMIDTRSPQAPQSNACDDSCDFKSHVDTELVKVLLNAGAKVNPTTDDSPLMEAARACDLWSIKLLLTEGADPNFKDTDGDTVLSVAINGWGPGFAKSPIVKCLIESGADVQLTTAHDGNEFLRAATRANDTDASLIQVLLDAGARPTESILRVAICESPSEIVNLLLNSRVPPTDSLIKAAVQKKRFDILRRLLDLAKGNVKKRGCSIALIPAIEGSDNDLIEYLLALGTKPKDYSQLKAALRAAAKTGNVSIIRLLLADDSKYRTRGIPLLGRPFYLAIANGHGEIADLLLEAGANINLQDNETSETPLFAAIRRKDVFISQKLLALGASVNVTTSHESNSRSSSSPFTISVLPAAVDWGHEALIRNIIRMGAEIDAPGSRNKDAKTALTIAVEKRNYGLVNLLLETGADVNNPVANNNGHTALVAAIRNNDVNMVHGLLRLGADPNESALLAAVSSNTNLVHTILKAAKSRFQHLPRVYGIRALQQAIVSSNVVMIEVLIKNGVNPNVIARPRYGDNDSNTLKTHYCLHKSPFGTALEYTSDTALEIIKMLLHGGADPNGIVSESEFTEKEYTTALESSIQRGNSNIVRILIAAGAEVNSRSDIYKQTLLQVAIKRKMADIVKWLLEKGADANTPMNDQNGETALQYTAMHGHVGIASLLLENGADVNTPAAKMDRRTALEGACEHGRIDMVQLLLSAGAQIIGLGNEQYERARNFATINGHIAVRRLLD